jgi:carboxymethylenebutenolidase
MRSSCWGSFRCQAAVPPHAEEAGTASTMILERSVRDGYAFRFTIPPGRGKPASGIVLFHHRDGFDGFTNRVVRALTSAGHAVVAPELFQGQPDGLTVEERKARVDDDWVLDATVSACAWLRETGVESVGSLGFCMGGRLSFLVGATGGLVDRASCFYGGDLNAGRPVPPSPIARVSPRSSPLQLHRGSRDSAATAIEQEAAVHAAAESGSYLEACTYAGARHAFLNRDSPERFDARAAATAWARAMLFLAPGTNAEAPFSL